MVKQFVNRTFVILLAVALGVVGTLAISAPVKAWGYCNPPAYPAPVQGYSNLYDSQGYCGTNWIKDPYQVGIIPGTITTYCVNMTSGNWNNQVSSVNNRTNATLMLFGTTDCSGPFTEVAPYHSKGDLCTQTVGCDTASSMRWHW
jgi:hypothetical protein